VTEASEVGRHPLDEELDDEDAAFAKRTAWMASVILPSLRVIVMETGFIRKKL